MKASLILIQCSSLIPFLLGGCEYDLRVLVFDCGVIKNGMAICWLLVSDNISFNSSASVLADNDSRAHLFSDLFHCVKRGCHIGVNLLHKMFPRVSL